MHDRLQMEVVQPGSTVRELLHDSHRCATILAPDRAMLLVEAETTRGVPVACSLSHIGVIVPTRNAAGYWDDFEAALNRQGLNRDQILVVDSSSTDDTAYLARAAGYRVVQIPQCEFNHGATRKAACEWLPAAEILVLMTQDAVLSETNSLITLCSVFQDAGVGAAYGRQLPRPRAKACERHARFFNYPARSERRSFEDRKTLGLKAAFLSNSFAAYRRTAMQAVGGFPDHVIVCEDVLVGAQMLMAGWQLAYVAEATVIHSHAFSIRQEFARYFDIGVNHAREPWLLETFGGAGGEGRRFVLSELRYLLDHDRTALPGAVFHTALKWVAYQMGRKERHLPLQTKRRLSSHPNFWKEAYRHLTLQ